MDDVMTRFSPKATRFIEAAVDELADHDVKAIWMSAGHDPGTEVPDHVARAALKALHHFENQLRARLDTYPLWMRTRHPISPTISGSSALLREI
jgi:hypothetical protein